MKSNRGFTLIEIIVSLAITIAILSSVLLIAQNVTDVFNNVSDTSNMKTSVDKISEYVRDQLEYSTDVTMATENKYALSDGWHYLYVSEGKLYRDGKSVYSDGYYNSGTLEVTYVGYTQSKSRMDLTYTLKNDSDSYQKKDTLKLLNLNLKDTDISYPDTDDTYYLDIDNTKNHDSSGKDQYLYYKSDTTVSINNNNSVALDGTVADKIYLMTGQQNHGYYKENGNDAIAITRAYYYEAGDYVYYEGFWWMRTYQTHDNKEPNTQGCGWTRLSPYYDKGVYSYYTVGDIVIYNNEYYQCTNDWVFSYGITLTSNTYGWKKIDKPTSSNYTIPNSDIVTPKSSPIFDRPSYLSIYSTDSDKIAEYSSSKTYAVGDFVKVAVNTGSNGNTYYEFYKKVFSTSSQLAPGTSASSGWELLENEYSDTSSYAQGKTVYLSIWGADRNLWMNSYYTANFDNVSNDTYNKYATYFKNSKYYSQANFVISIERIIRYTAIDYNQYPYDNVYGYMNRCAWSKTSTTVK